MRYVAIFVVLFILTACSSGRVDTQTRSFVDSGQDNSVPDQAELQANCEEQGGVLVGCETQTGFACSVPTKDAGKPCLDSDECEAGCVAPANCAYQQAATGSCADNTALICSGVQFVEGGRCSAPVAT